MRGLCSLSWGFAAVAVVMLVMNMTHAWHFTVDDTFITLRYSRNVAEGLGPTFNAGGPRAEGYTTFSWMALLVVPHVLGLDAPLFAKGAGVLATFATLFVAARWARAEAIAGSAGSPQAGAWAGATAAVCLAAVPATAIHAVSGMETALFTLLLTAMFAASAEALRGRRGASNGLVVLALAAGLTRPEGNFAAFVAIATTTALLPREVRATLVLRAAVGWLVPLGVYELWRRGYYGLSFPLPFYVKLATPGRLPGWPDVRDWLRGPALHFGLLFWPALVRPPRSLLPALASMAALIAFFVLPQHQMGYDHRYLAPLDPLARGARGNRSCATARTTGRGGPARLPPPRERPCRRCRRGRRRPRGGRRTRRDRRGGRIRRRPDARSRATGA